MKTPLTLFVSAFDLFSSACLLHLAGHHREAADAACPLFISVPPPLHELLLRDSLEDVKGHF